MSCYMILRKEFGTIDTEANLKPCIPTEDEFMKLTKDRLQQYAGMKGYRFNRKSMSKQAMVRLLVELQAFLNI